MNQRTANGSEEENDLNDERDTGSTERTEERLDSGVVLTPRTVEIVHEP